MLSWFLLSIMMTGLQANAKYYVDLADNRQTVIVSECPAVYRKSLWVFWRGYNNIQVCNDLWEFGNWVVLHEIWHAYAMEDWREYHKSEDFADAFAIYMYYITFWELKAPRGTNMKILKEIMLRFGNNPEEYLLTTSHTIKNMLENGVVYGGYFNWL